MANILVDGLWHTTSKCRYDAIKADGTIRVEPKIPDAERHKTANGPANYPFVRSLGGVSLFDFSAFDPEWYGQSYPLSSWVFFVPVRSGWTEAIWIEIDRTAISSKFIDGKTLLGRWRAAEAYGHTIMPIIEAAHIGDLSETKFLRSLAVSKLGHGFGVEPLTN